MAIFTSDSAVQTEEIARRFGESVQAGDILALQGDLGAGKTHFAKGIVAGLGGKAEVTSPTFTIVHEYPGGRLPVYHFDFFRLEDGQAARRLGLDDYFFGDGISIVEWPDRFAELIPAQARWIRIEITSSTQRLIHLP